MIRKVVYVWAGVSLAFFLTIGIIFLVMWVHGLNARPKPSSVEATIAMATWESSIPDRYNHMKTPFDPGSVDMQKAGARYYKMCASCHGVDGKGQTASSNGIMYPRPANITSDDTQEKSDGELYWILNNGVRWSGMPAFGKPGDDDHGLWTVVAFLRKLPQLTPRQQQQMEQGSTATGN